MSSPSFSQEICWGAKKIQQKTKIMLCAMQNYRSKAASVHAPHNVPQCTLTSIFCFCLFVFTCTKDFANNEGLLKVYKKYR